MLLRFLAVFCRRSLPNHIQLQFQFYSFLSDHGLRNKINTGMYGSECFLPSFVSNNYYVIHHVSYHIIPGTKQRQCSIIRLSSARQHQQICRYCRDAWYFRGMILVEQVCVYSYQHTGFIQYPPSKLLQRSRNLTANPTLTAKPRAIAPPGW